MFHRSHARRIGSFALIIFAGVAALSAFSALAKRVTALSFISSGAAGTYDSTNKGVIPAAVSITTATLTDNVASATKVATGSKINYTATFTTGGVSPADDLTNVNYSGPLDANTALVAGSVHATPIAFNDTYSWIGNTFLDTTARALPNVTANDVSVNAPDGTDGFYS